ncbi:hypothetical protein MPSEU_000566000 [Mayamaea pseudoterrestris]|nr:hypothetical protein MPSEU_000566000 [Mayamaea pseudoterrestris]
MSKYEDERTRQQQQGFDNTLSHSNDEFHSAIDSETTSIDVELKSKRKKNSNQQQHILRRRRRRRTEVCEILNLFSVKKSGLDLPPNQYERTLIRRAVRKREASDSHLLPNSIASAASETELFGDVSLGMKLTVIAGKVIVQTLTWLADGRASPAQLAGSIQRGDVLLAINDYSLVGLSPDQLMRGLTPLSTPNTDGMYMRELKLRFMANDGSTLLERNDAAKVAAKEASQHVFSANEMFSLFPMVDQLGGYHYGESDASLFSLVGDVAKESNAKVATPSGAQKENGPNFSSDPPISTDHIETTRKIRHPLDEIIARDIAAKLLKDKERFISVFSAWNDGESNMFGPMDVSCKLHDRPLEEFLVATSSSSAKKLSHAYGLERGERALIGAKALSDQIDFVNNVGQADMRSFKSWTTTISLYSRASARRMAIYDGASLPVNFGRLEEHENEDRDNEDLERENESDMSGAPGIDADEHLVQMAAHDEVWRNQVVEFFSKYNKELHAPATRQTLGADEPKVADMNTALSNELGEFLFGESMSRIMKNERKSLALPPEDVTLVLFDLTTKICATIPNLITAAGATVSYRSSLSPFATRNRSPVGSDAFLATHFLLNQALPLWLQSFHPLCCEQRRMLWPIDREPYGGSTAASTLSDELSTDSMSTSQRTQYLLSRKRKNLRERIEEQEFNVETRMETCFLTTFYFIEKVLAMLHPPVTSAIHMDAVEDEIISFIATYGSYLKMHTCLVCAGALGPTRVMDVLLSLAKHDPRHKEVIKQLTKATSLVFYESSMLSGVLQLLASIRACAMKERRLSIIDLCASAFPDVRPSQVKVACGICDQNTSIPDPAQLEFDELYYIYLSQLLHPIEGHETARRDTLLVLEWCNLSIHGTSSRLFMDRPFDRMDNFVLVTSDRAAYERNLIVLMQLAMDVQLNNIALNLAVEIIQGTGGSITQKQLGQILEHIRTIGFKALETGFAQTDQLRKILGIFKASSNKGLLFNMSEELVKWIEHQSFSDQSAVEFTRFLANEVESTDGLSAILLWIEKSDAVTTADIIPALRIILSRAPKGGSHGGELSDSLLQLRRARRTRTSSGNGFLANKVSRGIWQRMASGNSKS